MQNKGAHPKSGKPNGNYYAIRFLPTDTYYRGKLHFRYFGLFKQAKFIKSFNQAVSILKQILDFNDSMELIHEYEIQEYTMYKIGTVSGTALENHIKEVYDSSA